MRTVSIIIPTYNYGEFLAEAMESALSQSYPNIDLIVVDDGSTDNTREIVEKYPVKYVYQQHRGVAKAKNNGVEHSDAEFFLILDSDDRLHPQYVELTLKEMLRDTSIGFVYTSCGCFGDSDEVFVARKLHHRFSVFRGTGGQCGAALVRRYAFDETDGYDEKLPAYEDWDLCIRLCLKGWKGKAVFEPIHFRRMHSRGRNPKGEGARAYCLRFLESKYWFMRPYVVFSRFFDTIARFLKNPIEAWRLLKQKILQGGLLHGVLFFMFSQ